MPVVLLVRHGQASFGADEYDVLSEVGQRQSALVGAELVRRGLCGPVPVSGGRRRQDDTALRALLGTPLRIDRRWDEYDHLGLLRRYAATDVPDGSSRSVQGRLDAALASWVDDPGGGWAEFADEVEAALRELVADLDSGLDAVVFTSGGVIAAVCARLLGLRADGIVALHRVTVNGGITKLVVGRGGVSLVGFNDHGHFEGADRRLLTYR